MTRTSNNMLYMLPTWVYVIGILLFMGLLYAVTPLGDQMDRVLDAIFGPIVEMLQLAAGLEY